MWLIACATSLAFDGVQNAQRIAQIGWDSFGEAGDDPQRLPFTAGAGQQAGVQCCHCCSPVDVRSLGEAGWLLAACGGCIDEAVHEVVAGQSRSGPGGRAR